MNDTKVLINASNLKVGGAIQVAISLINSLLDNSRGLEAYFVVSPSVYRQLYIPKNKEHLVFICDINVKSVMDFFISRSYLFELEKKLDIDLVFSVFGPSFWNPKNAVHLMGFANAWLVSPDSPAYSKFPILKRCILRVKNYILAKALYKKENYYVTETLDVKERFCKTFLAHESVIEVVGNCLSPYFLNNKSRSPELDSIKKFKFLTVSHNYPHKNLNTIISVGKMLYDHGLDVIFVVTIPHNEYSKLLPDFQRFTYNLGPVSIAECPKIYNSCDALYLPTLIECFTVSYLEAMSAGIPIFTSDFSFSRNICGDLAYYFDPFDEVSIFSTLFNYLSDINNDKLDFFEKKKFYNQRLEIFGDNEHRVDSYVKIINELLRKYNSV